MNLGISKIIVTESPPLTKGKTEYEDLMKRLLKLKRPILWSLRGYAKSKEVRKEAFYEALAERCLKGEDFVPEESERAYLKGITKKKLMAKYRKDQQLKISAEDPIGMLDRLGMDISRVELPEYLLSCLRKLENRAPNWYSVVKWFVMHELSLGETMEKIGKEVQEDTIRQWKKRGLDTLKACAKKFRK